MKLGTCKWYDTTKGYGFIIPDELGKDIFCHQSSINVPSSTGFASLREGERVEYGVCVDPRTGKEKAINVSGPNKSDVLGLPDPEINFKKQRELKKARKQQQKLRHQHQQQEMANRGVLAHHLSYNEAHNQNRLYQYTGGFHMNENGVGVTSVNGMIDICHTLIPPTIPPMGYNNIQFTCNLGPQHHLQASNQMVAPPPPPQQQYQQQTQGNQQTQARSNRVYVQQKKDLGNGGVVGNGGNLLYPSSSSLNQSKILSNVVATTPDRNASNYHRASFIHMPAGYQGSCQQQGSFFDHINFKNGFM